MRWSVFDVSLRTSCEMLSAIIEDLGVENVFRHPGPFGTSLSSSFNHMAAHRSAQSESSGACADPIGQPEHATSSWTSTAKHTNSRRGAERGQQLPVLETFATRHPRAYEEDCIPQIPPGHRGEGQLHID
jgi:hypothetical protein